MDFESRFRLAVNTYNDIISVYVTLAYVVPVNLSVSHGKPGIKSTAACDYSQTVGSLRKKQAFLYI